MTTPQILDLRQCYDVIFSGLHHQLVTPRGKRHSLELLIVEDMIAGPIYSIKEYGGCACVYADQARFHGVDSPVALRERFHLHHRDLLDAIAEFSPSTKEEVSDLAQMRERASDIWALVELACDVEIVRWNAAADSV
ncbi:hypothetical protein TPR58_04230 [Sphingomonas sp. HF-S3]|uniref:Uncharacterized protein n=1 Tax=Sphingomonas rustica TaxID=3103142 RepID=A0ABV0B464_9SPHN